VLQELGRRQCNDVLVEAGPTLAGQFLQLGLADELVLYVAPVLLGPRARAMATLPPLERLEHASRYEIKSLQRIEPDVRLVLRRPAGSR
jgi:diaminohydroxyphosphoribosylaminopyrimidine deaminase / 5-amino-6-(5-phosphoribosylamino)uracil reductase